jgi:tripartite-type tricarboxylate transporter receptor subunit TctC
MQTLRGALASALAQPEIRSRLASLDMVPLGETGDAAARHLATSQARYGTIVKATGMKVD